MAFIAGRIHRRAGAMGEQDGSAGALRPVEQKIHQPADFCMAWRSMNWMPRAAVFAHSDAPSSSR